MLSLHTNTNSNAQTSGCSHLILKQVSLLISVQITEYKMCLGAFLVIASSLQHVRHWWKDLYCNLLSVSYNSVNNGLCVEVEDTEEKKLLPAMVNELFNVDGFVFISSDAACMHLDIGSFLYLCLRRCFFFFFVFPGRGIHFQSRQKEAIDSPVFIKYVNKL